MSTKSIDLIKDTPQKVFWSFVIPSIIAMVAENTASIIDSIFIGRYVGAEGLSALTLLSPFIMILAGVGIMIAIGGTTLAGIERGKNNYEQSNNIFNMTTWLLFAGGIIGTILFYNFIPEVSSLLGATGRTQELMIEYARTFSFFIMPLLMAFTFGFFIKLDGKPMIMVGVVVSGMFINIILDYLMVGVWGWGVTGAALATGISKTLPWIYLVYYIIRHSSWEIMKPFIDLKIVWRMILNGSSELLSMSAGAVSGLVFNMIIIKYIGLEGVAAFSVTMQVTMISTALFYGVAEAIQSPVSVNIGALEFNRVKQFRELSLFTNGIIGVLIFMVSQVWGIQIAKMFIKEPHIIEMSVYILRYISIGYLFTGANITLATYYTAIDAPLISGVLTAFRTLVALLVSLFVLPLLIGEIGIWLSVPLSELLAVGLGILYVKLKAFGSHKVTTRKEERVNRTDSNKNNLRKTS